MHSVKLFMMGIPVKDFEWVVLPTIFFGWLIVIGGKK